MIMTIKNMFRFMAASLVALVVPVTVGMNSKPTSAQLWYQSDVQKKVTRLNTSFAYLVGAAKSKDLAPRDSIKKYVEQTKQDLDILSLTIQKYNWCPKIVEQAFGEIKSKLDVDYNTAWTGSYVITHLGEQFTLAQDMKNWLLCACDQTDNKKQSNEFMKLKLMWLEKDYLEIKRSIQEEESLFKRSSDYVVLKYQISAKKNQKELSWWNTIRLHTSLASAGLRELVTGESVTKKQEQQYKEDLVNLEVTLLEDELNQYAIRLAKADKNYSDTIKQMRNQKITFSKPLFQTTKDELIFRDKQSQLNSFYDVMLQLFNAKPRQDVLMGEKVLDSYNPVKYGSGKVSTILAGWFGFAPAKDLQSNSVGHQVCETVKVVDTFLWGRDIVGGIPSAVVIKCCSMMLSSDLLCQTIVGSAGLLGQSTDVKNIIDDLRKFKKDIYEFGFTLNDLLEATKLIGSGRIQLLINLCCKAIRAQPEKFAGLLDDTIDDSREWFHSTARKAIDEDALLTYCSDVNFKTQFAPILYVEPRELTVTENVYNSISNNKMFAVMGFAATIYGGYRYGAHTWIAQKIRDVPVKDSLANLGSWAYSFVAPSILKK
jgi:hypothetical protein